MCEFKYHVNNTTLTATSCNGGVIAEFSKNGNIATLENLHKFEFLYNVPPGSVRICLCKAIIENPNYFNDINIIKLNACADERGLTRLVEYYKSYGFISNEYSDNTHAIMQITKTQLIQYCSTGGNKRRKIKIGVCKNHC